MSKIINISDPEYEDLEKYKQFSREKIDVTYTDDNKEFVIKKYLDDEETKEMIINYYTDLNEEKRNIHIKNLKRNLNKRLKWNLISLGAGAAILFFGIEIGNLLMYVGVNKTLISIVIPSLISLTDGTLFYYVNQNKFYYSKNENKRLEEIKEQITKCEKLVEKVNEKKPEDIVVNNYRRDQIDNTLLRQRNYERNVNMNNQAFIDRMESRKKIDDGVQRIVSNSKNKIIVPNYSKRKLTVSENVLKYKNKMILEAKKTGIRIGHWVKDAFTDEEINQNDNYMIRGEKRRR